MGGGISVGLGIPRSIAPTHAHSVAAMAVVVDTKAQAAGRFYRHFDFRPRQRAPPRLCLPMASVPRC